MTEYFDTENQADAYAEALTARWLEDTICPLHGGPCVATCKSWRGPQVQKASYAIKNWMVYDPGYLGCVNPLVYTRMDSVINLLDELIHELRGRYY